MRNYFSKGGTSQTRTGGVYEVIRHGCRRTLRYDSVWCILSGMDRQVIGLSGLADLPVTYMSCVKHRIKDHEETNMSQFHMKPDLLCRGIFFRT